MKDGWIPIVLILGIGYIAWSSGALAPLGIPAIAASPAYGSPGLSPLAGNSPGGLTPNISMTAPVINQQTLQGGFDATQGEILGVGAAGAILSSSVVLAHIGVAANAVPIVGQAVAVTAAIAAALLAAHEQRKKQAQSENAAMNLGVAGWDSGLRQVNAAFNARQITASDAIAFVQSIMQMYWQEVGPHIQPGRNGCANGSACPPWPASGNGCSGSIGAACCVGCYDLAGGPAPHVFAASEGGDGVTPFYFGSQGTILALQHGGGMRVLYQHVYGSKYGGKDRPAYTLNWTQVSAA
jgi:hypothetical protein